MIQKKKLIPICEKYTLPEDFPVVIGEPYAPFMPENWNGYLVLSESQNLSRTKSEYVTRLRSSEPEQRFFRLSDPDNVGIQPWDDGSLKLAVQSAFGIQANETAVSNSVVWSQVTSEGNNANPSKELIELSSSFWSEILMLLKPECIITSGKVASDVIDAVKEKSWQHIRLRLPSPNAMSRVSGMFPEKEFLLRYPEVGREINDHPEWVEGGYRQNKVFFACHAVTVAKAGMLNGQD
ncbi:MAG: hypothetical protein KAH24_05200 [Holophagae bacterium]|nr:hypothetical protein [Holophagae bacterium]